MNTKTKSATTEIFLRKANVLHDLTKYRLNKAAELLELSKIALENGYFKGSINRSYYAIFSATRALLSERYVDFKKHSAIISYFRHEFVKTGVFDVKFSDYIGDTFDLRNDCDYFARLSKNFGR